jgi:hypothetical protein
VIGLEIFFDLLSSLPSRANGHGIRDGGGLSPGELRQELLALTGAEAADAPLQNDAGYIVKQKNSRHSRYQIQAHLPLPEPTSRERTVGEVLTLLGGAGARL